MEVRGPHGPTLAVRRAAYTCVLACTTFWLLVAATAELPAVTERSPWSNDPYTTLLGLATILILLLAAPTWLRAVVHGGPVPAPPHAVRTILAGGAAALVCVGFGIATCVVAVVRAATTVDASTAMSWDLPTIAILAVLVLMAGTVALGAELLLHSRSQWSSPLTRLAAADGSGRPDVLDDVATLAARLWPGSAQARAAAWLNRGLDTWTWSPRRHRTTFVWGGGTVAGTAWTVWHAVVAGPWANGLAQLAFAVVSAGVFAAGLAGGIAWLGFLRPAPAVR